MRPHLIIDIGDRSIFSLMVDRSGNAAPCTHRVMDGSLRYFFGEIFLIPTIYLNSNEKGGTGLVDVFENDRYDAVNSGEKVGWMWPYQLEIPETAIPVKHPLKVLSSLSPSGTNELIRRILKSCYGILEIILSPIFRFVKSSDFDLKEIDVVVIIPGYFNRQSRLMLHKIFRKKNVYKSMVITRDIAAMMSCLDYSSVDNGIVLDMEDADVHCYRVEVDKFFNTIQLKNSAGMTLQGSGWNGLVQQFSKILYEGKYLDELNVIYQSYTDKALMKLIYGMGSTQIPSSKSVKITYDLFDKLFLNPGKKTPTNEYNSNLIDWLSKIVRKNDIFIPTGLPLMIGNFEAWILSRLKSRRLQQILGHRSIERTAYGASAGINWLYRNPDRKIHVCNHAGIRVATQKGESLELVAHASLPGEPGSKGIFHQVLDFHMGENIENDVLNITLLWGNNPNSKYNATLCILFLNAKRDDFKNNRKIRITLHLQREKTGRCIMGTVEIHFGNQHESGKFTIMDDAVEICGKDIM